MDQNRDILSLLSSQVKNFSLITQSFRHDGFSGYSQLLAESVVSIGIHVAQLIDRVDVSLGDQFEEGSSECMSWNSKVLTLYREWLQVANHLSTAIMAIRPLPAILHGYEKFRCIQSEVAKILQDNLPERLDPKIPHSTVRSPRKRSVVLDGVIE